MLLIGLRSPHSPLMSSALALLLLLLGLLARGSSGITPGVTPTPTSRPPESSAAEKQQLAALQQRNMLENSVKPFYEINNKFLDIVQPSVPNTRVIMNLVNTALRSTNNASVTTYFHLVLPVVTAYPGYTALLCLGLLLFLVVPVVGACWCSCRCCCNRCGATAKPMDGKFARCRRGVFGVLLGVLSTLILGGAVLSFISNDLLHQPFIANSIDNPVTVLNSSLTEVADNLDSMLKTFNNQTLLILNDQVPVVKSAVKNASLSAQEEIVKKSKIANLLNSAESIASMIRNYLSVAQAIWDRGRGPLNESFHNMTSRVDTVKENLTAAFQNCTHRACNESLEWLKNDSFFVFKEVNYSISKRAIQALKVFNSSEIRGELEHANSSLLNISTKMSVLGGSEVDDLIANLNDSRKIEAYFQLLQVLVGNMTGQMRGMAGQLNNGTVMNKKWAQFLVGVDEYRMYGFIGLASTILLIVFFFYLGLCFGACGEPPYEDARFCNRGAGATLMSCGIGFTFLFFPLVVLLVTTFFMAGAPVRTEMCRFLLKDHPNTSAFDSALAQVLTDLNLTLFPDLPFPPNLTYHLLGDCENNTSLVTALNLQKKMSGSIIYRREVELSVVELRNQTRGLDLGLNLSLVDNQTEELINRFDKEGLNLPKTFMDVIQEITFEGHNMPITKNVEVSLRKAGDLTNSSQQVNEIISLREAFEAQVNLTVRDLRNLSQMANVIGQINDLRNLMKAFKTDTQSGSALLTGQIDSAFDQLNKTVRSILIRAVDKVLSEHASCRVMHSQATRVVKLMCKNLLDPFNGYWLGIGWSLLILLPSLVLACKLNYLYRKTEYYVKDYEETDYLTYQGFYPSDVIPLERKSRGKNKQAKAPARTGLRGANGGILRHTGPLDPLPSSAAGPGMPDRRGWQHPYTKLPVYPRDAYD